MALSGFSPALPTAARGFLSNTIMVQSGGAEFSFDDLWKIVGTLGDYTWNPGAYDPNPRSPSGATTLSTAHALRRARNDYFSGGGIGYIAASSSWCLTPIASRCSCSA